MPSFLPIITVRVEDELLLKMKKVAEVENRSLNKQIVTILKSFIKDYESKNGEIKVNPDTLYE